MYIVDSSLPEENMKAVIEKINGTIKKNGELLEQQNLGDKKLAYPIKRKQRGTYILNIIKGENNTVSEAERTLKITDGVLRYLTIRPDKTA
jgi:small subunit ribosomal protein S6